MGGGCTGRGPWGDPCMPHRCNGRNPMPPWRIPRRRPASRPQLPECNSTKMPPPSHTHRRLSVRVIAAYWLPLIAFDGGIINLCQGFVKGFLKIYAENFSWVKNMQIFMRICREPKAIPIRNPQGFIPPLARKGEFHSAACGAISRAAGVFHRRSSFRRSAPRTALTPAATKGARIIPHTPKSFSPAYMEKRDTRGCSPSPSPMSLGSRT